MDITSHEAKKYASAWSLPGYANHSPGERWFNVWREIVKPDYNASVLDCGAGSGAASRCMKDAGFAPTALDITDTAWAHDDIHLVTGCLWKPLPVAGLYRHGFCCDVMEHIPPEFTALVVNNILGKCADAFFSISFVDDAFGKFVGEPLHLTVRPFKWWLNMLSEIGTVVDARDCIGEGVFYLKSWRHS